MFPCTYFISSQSQHTFSPKVCNFENLQEEPDKYQEKEKFLNKMNKFDINDNQVVKLKDEGKSIEAQVKKKSKVRNKRDQLTNHTMSHYLLIHIITFIIISFGLFSLPDTFYVFLSISFYISW